MVIAIIVLLAALLLPALRNAKDSTYSAVCSGNLRQLSLAAHLYANEYDDKFPDAIAEPSVDTYYLYWTAFVRHYLGPVGGPVESRPLLVPTAVSMDFRWGLIADNDNLPLRKKAVLNNPFFCPSTNPNIEFLGGSYNAGIMTDYGMSLYTGGNRFFGPSYVGPKRSSIKHPAQTMVFADCYGQPTILYSGIPSPRHRYRTSVNSVQVDGHVESCKYQIFGPYDELWPGSAEYYIQTPGPWQTCKVFAAP